MVDERSVADGRLMHIGDVAERTALSHRTIRHYDEVGLLRPAGRTNGGFRLYTEGDVARLLMIRRMKPLGFTLEEMAQLLQVVDAFTSVPGEAEAAVLRNRIAAFAADARARRARLVEQLRMADEFLDVLGRLPGGSDEDGAEGHERG